MQNLNIVEQKQSARKAVSSAGNHTEQEIIPNRQPVSRVSYNCPYLNFDKSIFMLRTTSNIPIHFVTPSSQINITISSNNRCKLKKLTGGLLHGHISASRRVDGTKEWHETEDVRVFDRRVDFDFGQVVHADDTAVADLEYVVRGLRLCIE